MKKSEKIEKLEHLKEKASKLIDIPQRNHEFYKWRRDTQVAIEHIFGADTRHIKDFNIIRYSEKRILSGANPSSLSSVLTPQTSNSTLINTYLNGMQKAISVLESMIDEVKDYGEDEANSHIQELSAIDKVKLLISRFHQVAKQLQSRHDSRPTIKIQDEYDVQDLFHSLLRIYFDDVREEEYTPSYAGGASRIDFLLKEEKIIIEIKKTREGLSAKKVGEEIIIDSQRYQSHPDCNTLICFVYDPEGRIANPRGIENDLTKELNGVPVTVYITP